MVAAYYATAALSSAFTPVDAIVWLPVGVGITALFLGGLQLWPAVVIGELLVNDYSGVSLGSAIGQICGGVLGVVVAAVLLLRLADRSHPFDSPSGVGRLLVALAAGTLISAVTGPLTLPIGQTLPPGSLPPARGTWWLRDLCGALIVVPLVVSWVSPGVRKWISGRMLELSLLLLTLIAISVVAADLTRPASFVALPALAWAAIRFGPRGATVAIAISSALTIWVTIRYLNGPAGTHPGWSTVEAQAYLVVSTSTVLALAAFAREREILADRLAASRSRIVAAADAERRLIERNLHDGAQQRLVVLAANLARSARTAEVEPSGVAGSFRSAQSELQVAIDELRDLVHGIRPQELRRFGFARAVERAAARSAAPVEIIDLPSQRVDDITEETGYYVVLEALTNAQRYSHASTIKVGARIRNDRLLIDIEDDGAGGAVEREAQGLRGLRDRIEATGGTLEIDSAAGVGTRISAEIPTRQPPGAATT